MPGSSAPVQTPRSKSLLPLLAWTLLAAFALGSALIADIREHPRRFELLYAAGFLGYLLLVFRFRKSVAPQKRSSAYLFIAAVALRIPFLILPCSDDVNRYLWEGRVQLAGHNPYTVSPDDPRLSELRDDSWNRINHPAYTAIYPPATMISCALVAAVWPTPLAFKLLHTFADLLTLALLMGWLAKVGKSPLLAAIYGLCPLTLVAFAGEGHNDSLMIAALLGCGYALACGRARLAALLLGTAVAFKLVAVLLLPWLFRRHARAALLAVLLVSVSFLPYLDAGSNLFQSLARFTTGKTLLSLYHGSLPGLLADWLDDPRRILIWLSIAALAAVSIAAALRTRFAAAVVLTFSALLITSPVVHYWYLTWLLAFLPLRFGWTWIAAAAAMGLYFEVGVSLAQTCQWLMPLWVGWVFWSAIAAVLAAQVISGRRPPESGNLS